ncbi:ABC transporter ATP-binding protein [Paraburkholderia sp. RP-4-7]|uniref:ABC transporter ATP-binding protein n=1 Tax=Paraburkholderia polaris TaxID=2728848 RepID=A0A848IV72_9BURK|nr:ABC transporter ATP-binding protein [Paraburkholderia polaris]
METNMAQTPLVHLKDVHKKYSNGTIALNGMSLEVGNHEFISFLGPSGCGKSTALRMIAGLSSISGGTIEWAAKTEVEAAHTHDISFVFQEPTLMPWSSVFENVYLPLKLRGESRERARARVEEALAMVGLSRFADVYPRELSGGMKMRASIARAMVTRPRLLLMDEPFAALDEMTRIKLNNDLLKLWQEHKFTVIFVTHSVYESVYLSNRVVVMASRPGRVIDEIAVPVPYPRGEAYRESAQYTQLCRETSTSLHRAMDSSDIDH